MLQRLTEEMEYSNLLDKAAASTNSLEEMCYVAAFTISAYSTTSVRTGKPFNPLLGETFEMDRSQEEGWRCLAEQVRNFVSAWWRVYAACKFRCDFLLLEKT